MKIVQLRTSLDVSPIPPLKGFWGCRHLPAPTRTPQNLFFIRRGLIRFPVHRAHPLPPHRLVAGAPEATKGHVVSCRPAQSSTHDSRAPVAYFWPRKIDFYAAVL